MPRYHISPMTGNPVACKAKIRCPFGDFESEHYDSRSEALEAYEKKNSHLTLPAFNDGKIHVQSLPSGMRVDNDTIVVPKGVYAIGDPIYTAGQDVDAWDDWIDTINGEPGGFDRGAVGATYNNYPVIAMGANMGPGLYGDSFGRTFEVESGVFGVTPVSLLKKMGIDDETIRETGSLVTFDEATTIKNEGGYLQIGDYLTLYTDELIQSDDDLEDDIDGSEQ